MTHLDLPDRTQSSDPTKNPYRQPDPEPEQRGRGRRRTILRWIVIPLVTGLLAIAAGVVVGAVIQRPEVDQLQDFEHKLVTQLYDSRGQIYRSYQRENRILLAETEMPDLLKQAIMAAEDANFLMHGGVDLKGIFRAAYRNVKAGGIEEGASTLTMQVARQIFLHRRRDWTRKIEEAFLAVELEKRYSKDQILTLWANLQFLGHGNYGMEAAARDFFGKSVGELTLAEAATLAGIPNRPSYYAIRTRPAAVKERRNYVLVRMLQEGMIDRESYDAAIEEPILVKPPSREPLVGPYFAEDVRRIIKTSYGDTALYDRGLQVHTTLDRRIQQASEDALDQGLLRLDHLKGWRGAKENIEDEELEKRELPSWTGGEIEVGKWYEGIVLGSDAKSAQVKIEGKVYVVGTDGVKWTGKKRPDRLLKRGNVSWFKLKQPEKGDGEPFWVVEQEPELEGAVLVIETSTGAIRAMVGGWDYDRNEFNRATQAHRQIGSAFKVFVFGAALENGFTAADTLFDGPAVFLGADNEESYSPRNYKRQYYGVTTLRKALQSSYNVFSVKLMDLVGVEPAIDFAQRCGIRSELPPYPSLALGAADLIPLELTAAYAAIVNNGIYVEPYLIEKIEDPGGSVLQQHVPQAHQAMDPRHAYVLTRMLRGVTKRGTAASGAYGLAPLDLDLGGKTGTTNAYTDAWFVGFTPRYTILSWVGYDKKRSIGRRMTGAAAALPIWTTLVKRGIEEGWIREGETFERPPGIVERDIEYRTGLLAGDLAEQTFREVFVEGNEPERTYDEHWARIIEMPWFLQEPYYLPKEGERMPAHIKDWTAVREVWQTKNREQSGSGGG